MRALHYIIIKTERTYNNTEKLNGIDITVNVDIDDVKSINRKATVVCAPKGTNLFKGEEVIVHHNIMRETIHTDGTLDKGHFYISDNYYWLPVSEAIMKKNSNGEWETLLDFVFIRPVKEEVEDVGNGLFLVNRSYKGRKENKAVLAITNKNLKGVEVGDNIIFSYNSEHEFLIDGELLYKCRIEDILAKE